MKKSTKTILWICLAALVAAVALYLIFGRKEKQILVYQTTTMAPTRISSSVTATGTVEPISTVDVGTQVSGIISKIYVDFNSEVKAGQLIAELDRSVLQSELASSLANLNSAKAEYEYQESAYNRSKGLHDDGFVSDSEYESALYSYQRSKYAYQQAQASYKRAQTNIGYARIYSPINGVVLNRAVDEGQTVASGFSTPTLFTIAEDLRAMRVIATVDEADIGEVLEGQRVDFTVDAYPDDTFNGTVTQVRLQATTTSNVVTYEVVIDAPNPDLKLKPGLTASVTIYTLDKQDVLAVPVRALRFTPENFDGETPENCVWVQQEGGKLTPVAVELGVTDGVLTEITSGLKEGDRVVTGTKLVSARKGGKMPDKPDMKQPQSGGNPFMPKPPGRDENKRTK